MKPRTNTRYQEEFIGDLTNIAVLGFTYTKHISNQFKQEFKKNVAEIWILLFSMGIDHLGRHLFSVGISTFCTPSGFFTGPKDPLRCLKYHARNLILELLSYFSKVKDTCGKWSISRLRTLYKSVSGKNDPHHLIVRQTRKICRNLSHLVITTPLIKVT